MLYHMRDSQRTQNIQISKVIGENEKCVFYFMEKNKRIFFLGQPNGSFFCSNAYVGALCCNLSGLLCFLFHSEFHDHRNHILAPLSPAQCPAHGESLVKCGNGLNDNTKY